MFRLDGMPVVSQLKFVKKGTENSELIISSLFSVGDSLLTVECGPRLIDRERDVDGK